MQAARRAIPVFGLLPTLPPVSSWTPNDLNNTTWSRPTSGTLNTHSVVTWESLVGSTEANRQAASPNTPTPWTAAQAKAVTGGVIISFPKGIFESENGVQFYRSNFDSNGNPVNTCAFAIGSGYAPGIAGYVGAGSRSTPGAGGAQTTLRMQGTMPNGTGKFNMLTCNGVTSPYFGGFNLTGNQTQGDGVFHEGLVISSSPNPIVERMTFIGVSPGYNSFPPGETFMVSFLRSNNALIQDCEFDGRDSSGNPTTASWGWNTATNAVVKRCWYHHGAVGMLTFWETVGIYSEDYWVDNVGYTTATGVSGNSAGINHEQSEGTIHHVRPHLYQRGGRSSARSGSHLTMHSAHADVGANMTITEPDWEPGYIGSTGMLRLNSALAYHLSGPGEYNMTDYATRWGYQYMFTNPTIIKNGVSLSCSPQFSSASSNSNPVTDKNQIIYTNGASDWANKDATLFYAKSNG